MSVRPLFWSRTSDGVRSDYPGAMTKKKPKPRRPAAARSTGAPPSVVREPELDLPDEDDAELDADLRALDRFRPSEHVASGGAPRWYALMLVIGGLVGILAAVELVISEMQLLADPNANLGCDINPVIGCGNSLLAWQSHLLFGIPNAALGTATFGVVLAAGLMFLAGARVARWFWQLMSAVVVAGLAFVAWFAYQSFTDIGTLCPWCMVSWAVVFVVGFPTLAVAAQGGHLPVPDRVARVLYNEKWLLIILTFLVLLVLIAVVFWNKWLLVFGL